MNTVTTGSIRERRAAEMRAVLAKFERSGLSQNGFCRRERLSLSTFTYWRRRSAAVPAMPLAPFIEIEVVDDRAPGAADEALELRLPGGLTAVITRGTSEQAIRRLLRAAGGPC